MHSDKDRNPPRDPEGKPTSESFRGGGDVIAKGGGDVIAKESVPPPGSAGYEEETKEGENVRTPVQSDQPQG